MRMRGFLQNAFAALFIFSLLAISAFGEDSRIQGKDLFSAKPAEFSAKGKSGLVAVFLSAVCPCSNSHLGELRALAKDFPGFAFVGIHSNSNEDASLTKTYFQNAALGFPILQDEGMQLADRFKALKTPHAFLLDPEGRIVYQGGVSSSRVFENADQKFLREALGDLRAKQKVRTPRGRTLGCVIYRGASHAL